MTDTANLEDGFYWVRIDNDWFVAELFTADERFWMFTDGTGPRKFDIQHLDEIDPRPIKREDVK